MAIFGSRKTWEFLYLGNSLCHSGLKVDASPGWPNAIDTQDSQLIEWRSSIPNQIHSYSVIADSVHPFDLDNSPLPSSSLTGISPGMAFMKQFKALGGISSNENIRITQQSVGGTDPVGSGGVGYWAAPGSASYTGLSQGLDKAIYRINSALAQSTSLGLKAIGVEWGTNDAIAGVTRTLAAAEYQRSLTYLLAGITGTPSVPVFLGCMVPGYSNSNFDPIRLALADVAASFPRCGLVDSTSVVGQTLLGYHRDDASDRLVGQRGAALALSL